MDIEFKTLAILAGLTIAAAGAVGFVGAKIAIGARMAKTRDPRLFSPQVEVMTRSQKRTHYHKVTREELMATNGKRFVAIVAVGLALMAAAALLLENNNV